MNVTDKMYDELQGFDSILASGVLVTQNMREFDDGRDDAAFFGTVAFQVETVRVGCRIGVVSRCGVLSLAPDLVGPSGYVGQGLFAE